ncbi:nascent polypeptide-associated complex subunit alpha, muscle-specific form-like [Schistocerca serialis cubense]|uniref:nascent polypeptide-associated complex subunit alpha, muscle-specific form-like n=1 Tax=Schistocerca serialis cubense TaxID=2023355 RepID=UPI00214F044F|nr:nascent polypeptide-associated complex subunit alpha, muscle-specific form-like [Schistocerca serialis cubense]
MADEAPPPGHPPKMADEAPPPGHPPKMADEAPPPGHPPKMADEPIDPMDDDCPPTDSGGSGRSKPGPQRPSSCSQRGSGPPLQTACWSRPPPPPPPPTPATHSLSAATHTPCCRTESAAVRAAASRRLHPGRPGALPAPGTVAQRTHPSLWDLTFCTPGDSIQPAVQTAAGLPQPPTGGPRRPRGTHRGGGRARAQGTVLGGGGGERPAAGWVSPGHARRCLAECRLPLAYRAADFGTRFASHTGKPQTCPTCDASDPMSKKCPGKLPVQLSTQNTYAGATTNSNTDLPVEDCSCPHSWWRRRRPTSPRPRSPPPPLPPAQRPEAPTKATLATADRTGGNGNRSPNLRLNTVSTQADRAKLTETVDGDDVRGVLKSSADGIPTEFPGFASHTGKPQTCPTCDALDPMSKKCPGKLPVQLSTQNTYAGATTNSNTDLPVEDCSCPHSWWRRRRPTSPRPRSPPPPLPPAQRPEAPTKATLATADRTGGNGNRSPNLRLNTVSTQADRAKLTETVDGDDVRGVLKSSADGIPTEFPGAYWDGNVERAAAHVLARGGRRKAAPAGGHSEMCGAAAKKEASSQGGEARQAAPLHDPTTGPAGKAALHRRQLWGHYRGKQHVQGAQMITCREPDRKKKFPNFTCPQPTTECERWERRSRQQRPPAAAAVPLVLGSQGAVSRARRAGSLGWPYCVRLSELRAC